MTSRTYNTLFSTRTDVFGFLGGWLPGRSARDKVAADVKRKIEEAGTCRFRLDSASSRTMTLPDGRTLGYAQWGSETGRPVIYIHGLPGSRVEAAAMDEVASRLGIRIIAVDRPGYGLSSPQTKRTVLDHPKDIQHLAEYLDLHEYAVLGISGGGPYTLACAYALPADKLKVAVVICGMGMPDMPKTGQNWIHWLGFPYGWRYAPWLGRWWFGHDIISRLDIPDDQRLETMLKGFQSSDLHPKDAAFFRDVHRMQLTLRTSRESFAQGLDAVVQDGHVMCLDWGFRIEDIRSDLPVHLWYGSLDTFCPPCHGEETARRLGDNATLTIEEETHASIGTGRTEAQLSALIEAWDAAA